MTTERDMAMIGRLSAIQRQIEAAKTSLAVHDENEALNIIEMQVSVLQTVSNDLYLAMRGPSGTGYAP